jgi:ubiquinone/menaquinone biosynthesis C-methylase UbiE
MKRRTEPVDDGRPAPFEVRKLPQLIFLKPEVALREAHIKPGQTVADLGSGGGFLTIPAAVQVGPQGLVYAVDILKDQLASIKSQAKLYGLPNVIPVWADLEIPGSSNIPADSVDVTLIFKVLCVQKKRDVILQEARRITKPGGTIMVAEWCEARAGFGPGSQKLLTRADLQKLVSDASLTLVKEHKLDDFHYVLELKRT